jgi:hypothetical protein
MSGGTVSVAAEVMPVVLELDAITVVAADVELELSASLCGSELLKQA